MQGTDEADGRELEGCEYECRELETSDTDIEATEGVMAIDF